MTSYIEKEDVEILLDCNSNVTGANLNTLTSGNDATTLHDHTLANITDISASTSEIDHLIGVAGDIQPQINGKADTIHNLVDTTNHPVAGLTSGHVMRATAATTYAFGALQTSDLPALASSGTTDNFISFDSSDKAQDSGVARDDFVQIFKSGETTVTAATINGADVKTKSNSWEKDINATISSITLIITQADGSADNTISIGINNTDDLVGITYILNDKAISTAPYVFKYVLSDTDTTIYNLVNSGVKYIVTAVQDVNTNDDASADLKYKLFIEYYED